MSEIQCIHVEVLVYILIFTYIIFSLSYCMSTIYLCLGTLCHYRCPKIHCQASCGQSSGPFRHDGSCKCYRRDECQWSWGWIASCFKLILCRELTYPTLGKGKSSSLRALGGDMLASRRVLQLACFFWDVVLLRDLAKEICQHNSPGAVSRKASFMPHRATTPWLKRGQCVKWKICSVMYAALLHLGAMTIWSVRSWKKHSYQRQMSCIMVMVTATLKSPGRLLDRACKPLVTRRYTQLP